MSNATGIAPNQQLSSAISGDRAPSPDPTPNAAAAVLDAVLAPITAIWDPQPSTESTPSSETSAFAPITAMWDQQPDTVSTASMGGPETGWVMDTPTIAVIGVAAAALFFLVDR